MKIFSSLNKVELSSELNAFPDVFEYSLGPVDQWLISLTIVAMEAVVATIVVSMAIKP